MDDGGKRAFAATQATRLTDQQKRALYALYLETDRGGGRAHHTHIAGRAGKKSVRAQLQALKRLGLADYTDMVFGWGITPLGIETVLRIRL